MIGLDTNVLVRLFVAGDDDQANRAQRFVAARCTPASPCFVNRVVLAELVWVLRRAYTLSRSQLADVLQKLLHSVDVLVDDAASAQEALRAYRAGTGDYVDHLIGLTNRAAGCSETATFDRTAALPGFASI